jgi:glyoxylase-like metal-dependent hydrolase (beta-lactamase superfamily II)
MHLTLGDVTIDSVSDIDPFALPLRRILPAADLAALAPHRALLEPDHLDLAAETLLIVVQSLLLRVDGLTILVDGCVGEDKPRPNRPDWHARRATGFLDRLAALGVAPDQLDFVFCTHLHADHVGWNTRLVDGRWVPTFPRARYLMGRRDLAHFQAHPLESHACYADSVLPVLEAGLAEPVDDGYAIAPGLTLLPLPGHTPGQMGLLLDRGGHRALFCGDAIHSPVQILFPDWSSGFCVDPAQAALTRRGLLERAVGEDLLLVPAHFRGCGCARIHRAGDAYRPVFRAD